MPVPTGQWGQWMLMAEPKRDALVALALDQAASYIADPSAREAIRRTLMDVARTRIESLADLASGGRQPTEAGKLPKDAGQRWVKENIRQDRKHPSELKRFGY